MCSSRACLPRLSSPSQCLMCLFGGCNVHGQCSAPFLPDRGSERTLSWESPPPPPGAMGHRCVCTPGAVWRRAVVRSNRQRHMRFSDTSETPFAKKTRQVGRGPPPPGGVRGLEPRPPPPLHLRNPPPPGQHKIKTNGRAASYRRPSRFERRPPPPPPQLGMCHPPPPPLCDIPSGCCFFTGPWTITRSSLRMLRRVTAFCQSLQPVLLLVSFPRSRSPVVGVPGLCWMWRDVPFARQRRPIIGVLRMCWLSPGSFDCFCCPHTSVHRPSTTQPPPPGPARSCWTGHPRPSGPPGPCRPSVPAERVGGPLLCGGPSLFKRGGGGGGGKGVDARP